MHEPHVVLQHHAGGERGLALSAKPEGFKQRTEITATSLERGHPSCPGSSIHLPAGVRPLLPIMGGAIVPPQAVPGVEGLLTVSTRIFLYRLLNRNYKKRIASCALDLLCIVTSSTSSLWGDH